MAAREAARLRRVLELPRPEGKLAAMKFKLTTADPPPSRHPPVAPPGSADGRAEDRLRRDPGDPSGLATSCSSAWVPRIASRPWDDDAFA